MRPANFVERKVVESLRLGIVPDEGLHLFTLGREAEIQALQAWLRNPGDPAHLVIGTYGTGKTHLLNYFRLLALSAGYAVSLVEMDPIETPFSQPRRVYSQIVRNLKWRDGHATSGFRELIERGLEAGLLLDHEYFQYMRGITDGQMWQWVDGSDACSRPPMSESEYWYVPSLYSFSTAANIYCYLLSAVGWLCRSSALNLNGLLVLFDESEALYAARSQNNRQRSINFVDALISTARDDSEMLKPAWQTNFTYSRHAREIPFLYRQPSGLKLLFAFTSTDDLWISRELESLPYLDLDPLDTDSLSTMRAQIRDLYLRAYVNGVDNIDLDGWEELIVESSFDTTRAMVKSAIEALDITRFGTFVSRDDD